MSLGLTSSFVRMVIYWIMLKIYSGSFLASFGLRIFRIFRITSFFFRMYDDLYFDKTWRIFSFYILSFFVDSGTNSPSFLEYWLTLSFSFLSKSKSWEELILGLVKSGKILYFFGGWELEWIFSSNYFLLKAVFGMISSLEFILLLPLREVKLDIFSDDPFKSSGNSKLMSRSLQRDYSLSSFIMISVRKLVTYLLCFS